jgi:hypothetical protein
MDCLLSLLKLLINLTHLNTGLANALAQGARTYTTLLDCMQSAQEAAPGDQGPTSGLRLDLLSLCLGLLSNLFESSKANREFFLSTGAPQSRAWRSLMRSNRMERGMRGVLKCLHVCLSDDTSTLSGTPLLDIRHGRHA